MTHLSSVIPVLAYSCAVPPKISCISASAFVGERDVTVTCEVRAKPRITSLFWIVDNGTTLSDQDAVDGYTSSARVSAVPWYNIAAKYLLKFGNRIPDPNHASDDPHS